MPRRSPGVSNTIIANAQCRAAGEHIDPERVKMLGPQALLIIPATPLPRGMIDVILDESRIFQALQDYLDILPEC